MKSLDKAIEMLEEAIRSNNLTVELSLAIGKVLNELDKRNQKIGELEDEIVDLKEEISELNNITIDLDNRLKWGD